MSDAVRVTHYKVIWEAGKVGGMVVLKDEGGTQHDVTLRDPAALAAVIATLRSENHLIYEPSGGRLYSGDFRPVGWIRGD
jgi:hypothetical protein